MTEAGISPTYPAPSVLNNERSPTKIVSLSTKEEPPKTIDG